MADKPSGLVQGTLDMLILKTLELEPMHGYGIAMRIEQISKGVFQVNPGSLFPAFRRLERAGWLKSEWRDTANNRRAKYYVLQALGRKQLKGETSSGHRADSRGGVVGGKRCHCCEIWRVVCGDCSASNRSSAKWMRNCAGIWTPP